MRRKCSQLREWKRPTHFDSVGSCWAIVRILISPSATADEFLAPTIRPGLPWSFSRNIWNEEAHIPIAQSMTFTNLHSAPSPIPVMALPIASPRCSSSGKSVASQAIPRTGFCVAIRQLSGSVSPHIIYLYTSQSKTRIPKGQARESKNSQEIFHCLISVRKNH